MKKVISSFLLLFCLTVPVLVSGQSGADKVKKEIYKTLNKFYSAAQKANTEALMSLFDTSTTIMFIGGDSAEIWTGQKKIREHLNSIFPDESVTLKMDRTNIDYNQNTAWVFADGQIIITATKGDVIKAPYRFVAILVKKNNIWKFRLFNGSNPGGG
jgi:ketosteroid isomerase-like protein